MFFFLGYTSDIVLSISVLSYYDFRKCSAERVQPNQTHFQRKKESLIMVDRQKALVERTSRSTSYDRDVILLLFFRLILSWVIF